MFFPISTVDSVHKNTPWLGNWTFALKSREWNWIGQLVFFLNTFQGFFFVCSFTHKISKQPQIEIKLFQLFISEKSSGLTHLLSPST